jgi:type II secretory pathway pseudopilin PulG
MRKGFTLIEVTIVVIIVIVLVAILLGTLNPITQLNKGHDATRKKDLKRIAIAFEEYYNDKGCYPSQEAIDALSCGSHDFYQLNPWPCDPTRGRPYDIIVGEGTCPGWFTVVTRLETEGEGRECNYGVASTNRDWRDENACYDVVITPTVRQGQTATNTPTPCVPYQGDCFIGVGVDDCNVIHRNACYENCFSDSSCSTSVCGCNY